MKRWQFDVLFILMVAGAVFLLVAPTFGLAIDPTALTGYGAVTTYVLTQRGQWTKPPSQTPKAPDDPDEDEADLT